jgi:hypothetical protein
MHYTTVLAVALGIASTAAAAPALSPRNTVIYATFYDDNNCSQNGGRAVSCANPGCLNESGRHSIYFQKASTDKSYNLVFSPSPNCPCQSYCQNDIVGSQYLPACVSLAGKPSAESFRFIEDGLGQARGCSANNC